MYVEARYKSGIFIVAMPAAGGRIKEDVPLALLRIHLFRDGTAIIPACSVRCI